MRISNAAAAQFTLTDRTVGKAPTVVVTASQVGALGNSIVATSAQSQALTSTVAFRHAAAIVSATGTQVAFATTDDAAMFRPGDIVTIDGYDADRATILLINGKTVTLSTPLPQALPGNSLRLASLLTAQGDRVIRFSVPLPDDPTYLTSGTVLTISNTTHTETVIVQSVAREVINLVGPPLTTYRVTLRDPVANDYGLGPADNALTAVSHEFDLTVVQGLITEVYQYLSIDPVSPRYFGSIVNNASQLVTLAPAAPPDPNLPPDSLPDSLSSNLAGGTDEVLSTLVPGDYQNGLDTLLNLDVNIVAIPDRQDMTTQNMIVDHCQGIPPQFGNRFGILDSQLGAPITGPGSVADQIGPLMGNGSGYAALYYPWVLVPPAPPGAGGPPPAVTPPNVLVPPSGHIAGMYARIDNSRGVHKAPAGLEAALYGTIAVERLLGDTDQGLLNLAPYGVNVIRSFSGGQPTVWGARTNAVAAGNTNWQYVNVRRLFIFLEQSISAGIRFAIFEPNNLELWGKLKRSITRVPDEVLAGRRAVRRDREGRVLRAHRRRAQPTRSDGARLSDHRDRCPPRLSRRIHRGPDRDLARRRHRNGLTRSRPWRPRHVSTRTPAFCSGWRSTASPRATSGSAPGSARRSR